MSDIAIIITDRLILREWGVFDAEELYDYAKNPDVGPHAGWKPHEDVQESRRIIEELFLPITSWAITEAATGRIIGSIGLESDIRRPNVASREMGYSLAKDAWDKGFMTEAAMAVRDYGFEQMNLDVLSICTGPMNKRSQRVIEKCGFRYEGTLRRAYHIYDGTERDTLCYSMLREEWEAMV